jgi:hypothetical protein
MVAEVNLRIDMSDHPLLEELLEKVDDIPVREELRKFYNDRSCVMNGQITQQGYFKLAVRSNQLGESNGNGNGKGHVLWNEWRKLFSVENEKGQRLNVVDFSSQDFSGQSIDFTNFEFGNYAQFQKSSWSSSSTFTHASWGIGCDFTNAEWTEGSNFENATWGSNTKFTNARWSDDAKFSKAQWGDDCDFSEAKWGINCDFTEADWANETKFKRAHWGAKTKFIKAVWRDRCDFSEAKWEDGINFENTIWGGDIDFTKAVWGLGADRISERLYSIKFTSAQFKGSTNFSETTWLASTFFVGATFTGRTKFSKSTFHNEAIFNNSVYSLGVHFDEVSFKFTPIFHGCELHQDMNFDAAKFPDPAGLSSSESAYRTLKLAFNKQQAVREEQRFFRLEMKEERVGFLKRSIKAFKEMQLALALKEFSSCLLIWIYAFFSDYGFSVFRPLFLWFLSVLIFAYCYGYFQSGEICFFASDCHVQTAWIKNSLVQSIPLSGLQQIHQNQIDDPSLSFIIAQIIFKIVSLLFFFLIGLALRNLLKLK